MHRLSGFPSVIYDTNCLVHYCFLVEVLVSGSKVTISDTLTMHTRQITEALKRNQQKVTTIQAAYDELRNAISGAVWRRLSHRAVEAQLGYLQGQHVPDQIKLQVMRNAERHVRRLETKTWFFVNTQFSAATRSLAALRRFFDCQPPEAFGRASVPGEVDLALINFGYQSQSPLVTDDTGIFRFSAPLHTAGLAFHIFNLRDITLPPV